jgi:SGNH domain (fused to AT3 domains)
VWELLIGAVVAAWSNSAALPNVSYKASCINGIGGLAGLSLIVWSLITFDAEMAFPGAAALIPCLGAAMIIYFGRGGSNPATRLLGTTPLPFVGMISYSLYLWHWPLIVFGTKYLFFGRLDLSQRVLAVLLSGLVAVLSWRWVEQPFRRCDVVLSRKGLYGVTGALVAVFGLVGLFAQSSNGWPERFPGIATVSMKRQFATERSNREWQGFDIGKCFVELASEWGQNQCFLSGHSQSKVLLWGDSFAARYAYGFFVNKAADFDVLLYTSPQCPPVFGYEAVSRPQCAPFDKQVVDVIQRFGISTVMIAANWASYIKRKKLHFEDISGTVKYLHSLGVRVVLVGQSPVFAFAYPDEYFYMVYGTQRAQRTYEAPLDVDPTINAKISAASGADSFLDPMALLCRGAECVFKDGDYYLFTDYGHFSEFGSKRMVDAFIGELHCCRTN